MPRLRQSREAPINLQEDWAFLQQQSVPESECLASAGVVNPPPRRPSLEEENRESAGTRESGASEASSRGGVRRPGGVPSCLSPAQRPSLMHRHSTGNSELQPPQQAHSFCFALVKTSFWIWTSV